MRLLNLDTLKLELFPSREAAPSYAILSHTWGSPDGEISFEDLTNLSKDSGAGANLSDSSSPSPSVVFANHKIKKVGWAKIEGVRRICCENLKLSTRYVWIDTCCIDKSSSAELQEAINSMFSWYEHSVACIIYLADVVAREDPKVIGSSFRKSRWFTRGWTLQELLAPGIRLFFDKDWSPIRDGSMELSVASVELFGRPQSENIPSLSQVLKEITGIDIRYLYSCDSLEASRDRISRASVAQKMSWASDRQTTRPEDIAYCLLGIFDIHMPMLYGEGTARAFGRLQEEIMKVTDDSSLLAWDFHVGSEGRSSLSHEALRNSDILAPHPLFFKYGGSIVPKRIPVFDWSSFSMTQRGLAIRLPLQTDDTHKNLAYGFLPCGPSPVDGQDVFFVAIPLVSSRTVDPDTGDKPRQHIKEYLRPNWCRPCLVSQCFLQGARLADIVIRRPGIRMNTSRLLVLPVTMQCNKLKLLGMYPPQPMSGNYHHVAAFERENPRADLLNEFLRARSDGNHHDGIRMLHVISPKGNEAFLVVLAFKPFWHIRPNAPAEDERFWVGCRVFSYPRAFSFERLYDLTRTLEFDTLKDMELPCANRVGERWIWTPLRPQVQVPALHFGPTDPPSLLVHFPRTDGQSTMRIFISC